MDKCYLLLAILLVSFNLYGQGIRLDENTDDWSSSDVLLHDDSGDNASLDIKCLGISDDKDFLYIKLEFDKEILIQGNNNITIGIETDDHQLSFNLGQQRGRFISTNINTEVIHSNLGLISSPTVSSTEFEIQIRKRWFINNRDYIIDGEATIKITNPVASQDQVPNNGEPLSYTLSESNPPSIPSYNLELNDETDFRFCSYNVFFDNLFESSVRSAYNSILSTINADIYNLQEIYDHSASETEAIFRSIDNSADWHSLKVGPDNILVSKYPIIYGQEVKQNGVFVVQHEETDILIINMHLPCCDQDREREEEIDAILSFIRNAKSGLSSYELKPGTPIIIAGDGNLVGNADQVTALMTGNIFNNNNSGPDFQIDWDSDGLSDLKPFATGSNAIYTWYNPNSAFSRGRLDYTIYSDYSLEALNSFVLDSERLTTEEQDRYNLKRGHTLDASDHYPMAVDFKFKNIVATTDPISEIEFSFYPNPASESIRLQWSDKEVVSIELLSGQGAFIETLTRKNVDLSDYPPGLYLIKLTTKMGAVVSKRLLIAR